MIVYIPAPSAQPLSLALWGLSRASTEQGPKDTRYLFPWVIALDGSVWLMVDTGYEINVHAGAVLDGIADILQPFIDAGQLSVNTNAQLAAFIESKRGGRLVAYEAFPPLFKRPSDENPEGQARTLPEMIEAGKFAQLGGIP